MKPRLRIAFDRFWRGFRPDDFRRWFPWLAGRADLVVSRDPEVVFYSAFSLRFRRGFDPRRAAPLARYPAGDYLRVFVTGENVEPDMEACDFAIGYSTLVGHPAFLRMPLWVAENRGWGYGAERLVKRADRDWERVADAKTGFCNFLSSWSVGFRDAIARELDSHRRVDMAGSVMNNLGGWRVPDRPNRLEGKIAFQRRYRFSLAIENTVWPGYQTEKLVDPMLADSVPIYLGDPQAQATFDPASYVDVSRFASSREAIEYVLHVEHDRDLYLRMLAAPWYRENAVPAFARDATVSAFFDRIVEAALARRRR